METAYFDTSALVKHYFLGIWNKSELYLIEVKDFRHHRIETRDRLLKGELAAEVAQKVRDSLSCIIGAYRTSENPDHWKPYMTQKRHLVAVNP